MSKTNTSDNCSSFERKIELLEGEVKHLKKELERSNQFKVAVLSNLSHEMRTPLNGILGFTEIISDPSLSNEDRKMYADVLVESGNALIAVVNDVLDITKIDQDVYRVYPVKFDLNDLLFQVYSDFKPISEKKNLQLFLENVISTPFYVNSDPAVLGKILNKLIDNALKFTKNGWVKFYYKEANNKIKFFVEDTGIGIPQEIQESIFERFTTQPVSQSRHMGGTGIDLSLCHGLVGLLGGSISLKSKLGSGSVFTFSISNL